MATYTIVSSTKTPLDPGEINAGGTITVADGDIFIIDPTADGDVNFNDGGSATNFEIQFAASNSNTIKFTIGGDLTPTVTISTGADLADVAIDAMATDGMTLTAGDNVSLGKLTGSGTLGDTITIGNGFTTTDDIDLNNGDNVVVIGDDATIANLFTGNGADDVTFGDRAAFVEVDTGNGADTIWFGDDINGTRIKGGNGDDWIRVGANATLTEINGQTDTDTLYTQTTGLTLNNIENVNVVCFAAGTLIETVAGDAPVERLRPGDLVRRLDGGFAVLRWVGRFDLTARDLNRAARFRPIRIAAGALGPGVPGRDLLVSAQHRILVRSVIAERLCGKAEVLVPAGKLCGIDGIERLEGLDGMTYFHLLFDRHEVLCANGAAAESMYLGKQTLGTLSPLQVAEIAARLAGAEPLTSRHHPARMFLSRKGVVRKLVARRGKNRKPLQGPVDFSHGAKDHVLSA